MAAASLVAVTPIAQRAIHLPTLSIETQLVDESLLNIPMNLLTDIANIPYNEVQALNSVAGSLFFGGNWWVPSATNLWGVDTGDPTHVALVTNVFAPFPDFSQGLGGLQYQLDGLLAAELPVSDSCDAETCFPMTPPEVITGSTSIDRTIGFLNALTGQGSGENFGLFQNWFKVPIEDLINGHTFDDAASPSGPAYADPAFGFLNDDNNPFVGGTVGDNDAMPWNGHTFYLNLFQPFQNYWEHLLQDPATDGDIVGDRHPDSDPGRVRSVSAVRHRIADRGVHPLHRRQPGMPGHVRHSGEPDHPRAGGHVRPERFQPDDPGLAGRVRPWRRVPEQQCDARPGRGVYRAFADRNFQPDSRTTRCGPRTTGGDQPRAAGAGCQRRIPDRPGLPGLYQRTRSAFEPVYGGWNPALVLAGDSAPVRHRHWLIGRQRVGRSRFVGSQSLLGASIRGR